MIRYHDTEWGVPLHDDRKLFEFLVLDAFVGKLSPYNLIHVSDGFRQKSRGYFLCSYLE